METHKLLNQYNLQDTIITDSHCHLNLIRQQRPDYFNDILSSSSLFDIKILDVGINPNDWHVRKDLFGSYSNIYMSVGLHPSQYSNYSKELLIQELEAVAESALAIGETGLDWYRMYAAKEKQIELFEVQIRLAIKYNKPLIIHARDSIDDILDLIQKYNIKKYNRVVGVMHCFSGNTQQAQRSINLGLYVSFAANISYSNSLEIKEALKNIPEEYILTETDAPYLIHKKQARLEQKLKKSGSQISTNSPLFLQNLYETIAEIKNLDPHYIQKIARNNFLRFLGIK